MLEGLNRVSGGERRIHRAPGEFTAAEERLNLLSHSRKHRLQVVRENAESLQADRAHFVQLLRLRRILGEFPGLHVIDVLVRLIGEFHHKAHGLRILTVFVELDYLRCIFTQRLQERIRHGGIQHAALKALHDEAGRARGNIHVLADQIGIHTGEEVRLREVDILDTAGQLGGEIVAQPLRIHAEIEILQRINASAAGLAHLQTAHGNETVCVDVIRHAVGLPGEVQHRRPEKRVEVNDVLADKVNLFGLRIHQEFIKILADAVEVGLQRGEIANRSVQPDVEVLARRVRNRNAEVRRVAGNIPVLKLSTLTEPLLILREHLRLHAGLAVSAIAARPLAQELHSLRIGELKEIVRGTAKLRLRAGENRIRIDELSRAIDRAADFTAVAILILSAAVRALALDKAVREEHPLLSVVVLGDLLAVDQSRGLQTAINVLGKLDILRGVSRVPPVELHMEAVQVLLAAGTDFRHKLLRRDTLLLSRDHHRSAVRIVSTHKINLVAGHPLMTHPDISQNVLSDMADMEGAVGIRQCRRYKNIALRHKSLSYRSCHRKIK